MRPVNTQIEFLQGYASRKKVLKSPELHPSLHMREVLKYIIVYFYLMFVIKELHMREVLKYFPIQKISI
jgi:hypothetical protein